MYKLILLMLCSILFVTSCSEDNTTNTISNGVVSFSSNEIPECSSGSVGKIFLKHDTKELILCTKDGWTPVAAKEISHKDTVISKSDTTIVEKGSVKTETVESCAVQYDSSDVHLVKLDCGSFTVVAVAESNREKVIVPGKDLVDERDSSIYRTIVMGSQTWLRDDLRLKVEGSSCDWDSCGKYTREYTWDLAMTSCPKGTHLPSKEEFKVLFDYVNAINGDTPVGEDLRSRVYIKDYRDHGLDFFGFDAQGSTAYGAAEYWTSDEIDDDVAVYVYIRDPYFFTDEEKTDSYPVRCILD